MKRLIALYFFLSFILYPFAFSWAWSVIAHTCTGTTDGGDGSSPLVSSAITTTGANFIIAYSSAYISATDITFSDSNSNTWHGLTNVANSRNSKIWYASAAMVGGSHTFTLSGSIFYNPAFCVMALSGSSVSDPFDLQATNFNSASETIANGTITPTQNNELVVTGLASGASAAPPTIGGGFTVVDSAIGVGHDLIGLAYLIQSTAAAANPTWTLAGAAPDDNQASIASFKETGGATPSQRRRMIVGIQ